MKFSVLKILVVTLTLTLVEVISQSSEEDEEDVPSDEDNFALKSVVDANSKFAKKFYYLLKETKPKHGNFVFSPYSMSTLLGMLRSGSTAGRKDELTAALELRTLSDKQITEGYTELLQSLPDNDDIEFKSLERIYVPTSHQIRAKFKESLQEDFSASGGVRSIDFGKSVTSAEKMNTWISQKTKGKMTSIVSPDSISKDTKLVGISAVYFRGDWEHPFTLQPTGEGSTFDLFYLNDTHAATSLAMMNYHGKLKYADLPDMRSEAVGIPFSGERLEMVVLIPKNRDGLQFPLEDSLKSGNRTLTSILTLMRSTNVNIFLPKFDAESFWTFSHTDPRSMIHKLGLNVDSGSRGILDYNGITPYPGLFLDKIVHKTMFSVTEKGNQAAEDAPAEEPGKESTVVRADHPFLYFIYDTETKVILLMGRKSI